MKILIVDNDENTIEFLKGALNAKTDYKIDVAYGGKEALEKMKADVQYNLLILDIMMPEINGIDVCKLMMEDGKLKNIPVLLISALPIASGAFQESLEEFGELGVIKDVIEKPFSIDEFLIKVRKILCQ
jgi:CheY-like chemotaxis protein